MKNTPNVYYLHKLPETIKKMPTSNFGTNWYPVRPRGLASLKTRLMLAWEVFSGGADVLRWPGNQ